VGESCSLTSLGQVDDDALLKRLFGGQRHPQTLGTIVYGDHGLLATLYTRQEAPSLRKKQFVTLKASKFMTLRQVT
jgi:hypothetical protein